MLKNKKKIRQRQRWADLAASACPAPAARRSSARRTLALPALTALLALLGGVTDASATVDPVLNTTGPWDAAQDSGAVTIASRAGGEITITTSSANTSGGLQGLTVGGATHDRLNVVHDLTFAGAVHIANGKVNIGKGSAFTALGSVTLGSADGWGGATIAEGGALRLGSGQTLTVTNYSDVQATQYTVGNANSHGSATGLVAELVDVGPGKLVIQGPLTLGSDQLTGQATRGIRLNDADSALEVAGVLTLTGGAATPDIQGFLLARSLVVESGDALTWKSGYLTLRGDGQSAADAILRAGALNIEGGAVSFGEGAIGGNGGFAGKVSVNAGFWNVGAGQWAVDQVAIGSAGSLDVGGTESAAILQVTGTAPGSFTNAATQVTVARMGQLHVNYDQIVDGNAKHAAVNKLRVYGGGLVRLTGAEGKTLSTADAQQLRRDLIQSTSVGAGLLDLGATNLGISGGAAAYTNVAELMSDTLTRTTVAINATNAAGEVTGGFKNLKFDAAPTADQTLKVNNSLLLAGAGAGTELVENLSGKKLTVEVQRGAALSLGRAGGQTGERTGGTLKADISLGENALFIVANGDFAVDAVRQSDAVSQPQMILDGATLRTGTVDGSDIMLTITRSELTTSDLVRVGSANILDGTWTADKAVSAGSINTVRGTLTTTAGKTPDGNVTASVSFGAADKGTASVGNDLTAGYVESRNDSTIRVGNDLTSSGKIWVHSRSVLNVGGTLTGAAGEDIVIGNAPDAGDGSMLAAQKTNLNGASLQVQNAQASLGELTAATGFIFADTAQVNIGSMASAYGGSLLAGKGGQIAVGGLGEAWARRAITASGAAADSAVLGINKSMALASGGGIVVDKAVDASGKIGNAAPAQSIYFGDKSLLVIDGAQFLNSAQPAAIVGDGSHTVFVQNAGTAQARLHISNVKTGDTVHVLSGVTGINIKDGVKNAAWLDGNITTSLTFDTLLFKGEGLTNASGTVYNVNVHNVGAGLVFPRLSGGMAGLVDTVMGQYGLQTDSANAGVRFVSRAVSNGYGLGGRNADRAAATLEGAAQMGAVAGVQVTTMGAASAASGAVTTRTSFARPLMDMTKAVAVHQASDGALSLDSGLNGGDNMKNGLGLWLMPLYQSNRTWGQKAESFKNGMSSDLGGIVLGADYTVNDMFRFGAAFNVGGGSAHSSGDFNRTENRFNFWGVNLYGGWTMNSFGLSADVGYTRNSNKVEQELPASLHMGDLKSDITSSAWTTGLKGEYKFETSVVDIIPHVGVRYMGLTTDSYDVENGGVMFSMEREYQSLWTFPVGVAFSKSIQSDSGWVFKPQVDLSVIPAAGDVQAKSKSRIPGVMGNAEMKMQVVDAITYDAGLGLEMGKDNLSFGLNYNIQASEHRTGHGVFGTLRYEF